METRIRNATMLDLPTLMNFARTVGRFICANETRTCLQVDPEALFVAETYPDRQIIGSCCGARLSPELGFMGLYVVQEEYRGKGIGYQLWKVAKEHLGDRNIGVRGDPVNFKKYSEKDGFCHVEDYVIVYYECFNDSLPTNIILKSDIKIATYYEGQLIGISNHAGSIDDSITHKGSSESDIKTCAKMDEMKIVQSLEKSSLAEGQNSSGGLSGAEYVGGFLPSNGTIEGESTNLTLDELSTGENQIKSNTEKGKSLDEFQESPFNSKNLNAMENSKGEEILSQVIAFDKSVHNRDRSFVVRQIFSWASCRSKVALMEGKVVGYACLRHVVTDHWIIAPFYADTEDVAEILLFELLQGFDFSQAPKGIILRFPDKNMACKRLAEKFGFKLRPTRILTGFTKRCLNVDTSKIYSFQSTVFCTE